VPDTRPDVVVVCDVSGLVRADLDVVDALARLALAARRRGRSIEVRRACPRLRELLELTGLDETAGLRLEPLGQPEEREQPGGVEEEDDPTEPVA
jgi:anti-anti-sigma regulatory factor